MREPSDEAEAVRHCPWCGELIGSFWARRDADGASWCESCQIFFHVEIADGVPPAGCK